MSLSKSQRSLRAWTRQKWRTKSGKPSTQGSKATGERYLPEAAIKALLNISILQATDLPLPTGPLMPRKKVLSFIKLFRTSPSGL